MLSQQQLTHRLNEALAHHKAGRLDRAEAIYRQLAAAAPREATVFDLWGRLAAQQNRLPDAVRLLTQACQLAPTRVGAAVQLASTLVGMNRAGDAEKVLRLATERVPNSHEIWNALGYVLKVQGRLVEALQCHERAVTLDPKFLEGWYHFGLTFAAAGRNFRALECHEKALEIDPRFVRARYGRAQSLHKIYRMNEAIADYDAYLREEPNNVEARSYRLFALQNVDWATPEFLYQEHCAYGRAVGNGPTTLPGYDLSPDKRLRVAILSPDFRTHSCAYFIEPLLRGLDAAQFEIYLYHDHFSEDEVTKRLRSLAAVWRNFVAQPHPIVERAIRADKPDILVDLSGHIGNTIRLPIFARRLAPVQITYLGYPDTTGVPAMDFRFTDAIVDPIGEADRFAVEKLVRFAPVAWTYQPPVGAPPVSASPASTGAPVTFGCFNSPTKFTPTLFAAWAKILQQVPGSRLLLKGRDFEEVPVREHMMALLDKNGIAASQVELLPRTAGTAEHLAQYGRVDIALDTFPYTGTTTTCEALWMGRPVITLRGNRHAARVGASLLSAVGHPEWICDSVDEYVAKAVSLSQDPSRLVAAAQQLRGDLQKSKLLDYAGQAAAFARALRECWRTKAVCLAAA